MDSHSIKVQVYVELKIMLIYVNFFFIISFERANDTDIGYKLVNVCQHDRKVVIIERNDQWVSPGMDSEWRV